MATTPKNPTMHDVFERNKYDLKTSLKKSRAWYSQQVLLLGKQGITPQRLMREDLSSLKSRIIPGNLYMFAYDPKTKEDMPYYDKFPLIIMVDKAPGGFHGINLHYLPPNIRAIFLDRLVNTMVTDDILTERSRIRLRYQILKSVKKYREFAPCFKHYLFDQMKTRVSLVPATEWDIAIFLPTEHFSGASKTKVWAESRKQYLKQR